MKNWPSLKKPPVVVALFQLKFNSIGIKLSDFLKFDTQIKHNFPIRRDNIKVGLNFGSSIPLGVSKFSGTSNAKIGSYVYLTIDQKAKFEILEDTITYIDERPYEGWDNFKDSTLKSLLVLSDILNSLEVTRTSIRFINRFTFETFDNPADYFKTLISSSEDNELPFPLRQYGFRLLMDIPDTDIFSIVNQNVDNVRTNSYIYTFDIDVLDRQKLLFEKETLAVNLEKLRNVKNEIFFNNITQKTIDLCN
ncbi:TIGR04255 family protein [Geofilum rhodophaeum]|uniref:TIGR04255 family protein n=1 Tax=Geofilum rhodophaeum TaxID=1965019 RepID=UPI000B5221C8|nr:TIGR04255 family protein [Geofilum rhodophaeum]